MDEPGLRAHAGEVRSAYGVEMGNVDAFIAEMVRRFI
jgi:hypothetical protein